MVTLFGSHETGRDFGWENEKDEEEKSTELKAALHDVCLTQQHTQIEKRDQRGWIWIVGSWGGERRGR